MTDEAKDEPYYGSHLYNYRATLYDWSNTYAVIVSGDGANFCGHALLRVGNDRFHIDGKHEFPWHLGPAQYPLFLKRNGKRQLREDRVLIPNPQRAQARLEQLTARKWRWGLIVHNCATFVENVMNAGGANITIYSNCPAEERFR